MSVLITLLSCVALVASQDGTFMTGVGIADVTGPSTEVDFMGYAFPSQTGQGIHLRLYSRAFIFEDADKNRVAYVSVDICMSMLGIKVGVVEELQKTYGSLYTNDNVMISGIHTHSGPGAFSWFLLYDISMFGFNKKHYTAVVKGIADSIAKAHADLAMKTTPSTIKFAQGLLANASRNRSPSSYLANPEAERQLYEQWGGDTDHNMTMISITNSTGGAEGGISFFAVHCTSMHNTNRLVSGDNKGYASYMYEREVNGPDVLPGQGKFVAAFGQSNEGDVSPNTLGAWCKGIVNGTYCGDDRSLCGGKNEDCISVGPMGFEDQDGSLKVIGDLQYNKAKELWAAASTPVTGKIAHVFKWVDMSNVTVDPKYTTTGQPGKTCRPGVGFSFAAGTTDGPGAFNFYQGDNCTNCTPLWNLVRDFIAKPSAEQVECQHPKPVLLDVGEIKPHPWVPSTLPLQIHQIGQLVIVAVPSEFTTMAGRRLRKAVQEIFASHGKDVTVLISGLANGYTQYTATYEEYQWQRYEAASTLYGPHQLAAYIQEYSVLAQALATGSTIDPGPIPEYHQVDFDLQPGVLIDTHPTDKPFGTVVVDVKANYTIGQTVNASFVSCNLRTDYYNDGKTYMEVQKQTSTTWTTVFTDANWETKVHWERKGESESVVTLQWDTDAISATPGTYRLVHHASAKPHLLKDDLEAFSGTSSAFNLS